MGKNTLPPTGASTCRLDKWLWCARFYKTRALASVAVRNGRVEIDDGQAKPSRAIAAGDRLRIRRGPFVHEVTVLATAAGRKSATAAAVLYVESPGSLKARELLAAQIEADRARYPRTRGRPEKRERRALMRFKHGG